MSTDAWVRATYSIAVHGDPDHTGGAHPSHASVSGVRIEDADRVVPHGLAAVARAGLPHAARLVIAGGDTSGQVLTLLGAGRLTTLAVLDRQTCLCRVSGISSGETEVVLKGGQIGSTDFFVKAAAGQE